MKRNKCIRKLLSFLTICCCLAGSIMPVFASGSGSGAPRVTFTNEPLNSPDLFVTKQVENALEGAEYAAPEHAAYRFVLKLDGQVAKNVEYRVFDAEHGEIVCKTSTGRNVPFQTDGTGVFTLEAGWQAWFEGVGTGRTYEVIEQDTYLLPKTDEDGAEKADESGNQLYYVNGEGGAWPLLHAQFDYETRSLAVDGFQKKSPAGGSTGEQSILANGSYAAFTNRYIGSGTGNTTRLEITKTVSFPEGYEAPDITPEFPFVIELDGNAYAEEIFTAVNGRTGETEERTTDREGRFFLPGGWTVVFENVPVDVDYRVYEDTEASGGMIGDFPVQQSVLSIGGTSILSDAGEMDSASDRTESRLAVAGSMSSEDKLSSGNRPSSSGAADDAASGIMTGIGWPDGWWPVSVTERVGATQAPLTALDFHNSNVSFVVTKRLEDYSRPENTYFIFRLADENNDALGDVTYYLYNTTGEPVYKSQASGGGMINRVTVNGKQIQTGRTDWRGNFSLEPGQAAVFIGLEPGTSYRVTEEKNPSYTQVLPLPTTDTLHTVPADGQISVIDFVNRPEDMDGTLSVTKSVSYGTGEGELSEDEFHFILYRRLTKEEAETLLEGVGEEYIKSGLAAGEIVLVESPAGGSTDWDDDIAGGNSLVLMKAVNRASLSNGSSQGGLKKNPSNNWYPTLDGTTYAVYAPAGGMIFSIPEGLEAPTYKTGPYAQQGWTQRGEFALKAGQTARFEDKIKTGDEYLVREVGLSEEYWEVSLYYELGTDEESLMSGYVWICTALPENGSAAQCVPAQAGIIASSSTATDDAGETIQIPGGLALGFKNAYMPKKLDLQLTKTDGEGKTIANEAHFMLYRTKGKESPVLPAMGSFPELIDPDTFYYKTEDGVLTIKDLKAGTYWLYELKAPSGYCLLPEPIEIDLKWTNEGLQITIDGVVYEPGATQEGDESKITYNRPSGSPADDAIGGVLIVKGNKVDDNNGLLTITNTIVNLEVRNTKLYELPNSGGIGIYWYSIGGTLLMLAASLILYKYQRRGRC